MTTITARTQDEARVFALLHHDRATNAAAIADSTPDSGTAEYFRGIANRAIEARDSWVRLFHELGGHEYAYGEGPDVAATLAEWVA